MGSGQPDKVLNKSILGRANYFLLANKLGVEDGFLADLNLVCATLSTLSVALELVLIGHRLEDFETSDNIDDQV